MKKKTMKVLINFVIWLCLGLTVVFHYKSEATYWQHQWAMTRLAWLQDRVDWKEGKPFERRYGRHHQEW